MFERFTERARQVLILAEDEARNRNHNYIGTEHLLLGLFREEAGLAARALNELGMTTESARAHVDRIVGKGSLGVPDGKIPFTPRTKKVFELALREALSLNHNYIGTEHLLLALSREGAGLGSRILAEAGASPEQIRNEIVRLITRPLAARISVTRIRIAVDDEVSFNIVGTRFRLSLGAARELFHALADVLGGEADA